MTSAIAPTSLIAERLKQRIWNEWFPRLVGELQAAMGRDSQSQHSLPADAAKRAQSLLLRLLISKLAESRGLLRAARGNRTSRANGLARTSLAAGLRAYAEAVGRPAERPAKLSPALCSELVEGFARDAAAGVEVIDYRPFDVRLVGEVYEGLLARTIDPQSGEAVASVQARKASGSFYTSAAIVDYIVEQTLSPLVPEATSRIGLGKERLSPWLTLRVLDPAMGCGYFLLSAARWLISRGEQILSVTEERERRRLRRRALGCLYGLDIDPLAVEWAQASFWLEYRLDRRGMMALGKRLRSGDALLEEPTAATHPAAGSFPARFEAVIGNPPYGATLSPTQRRLACRRQPQMLHNGDTAVGFIERAHRWLAPRGRCGLIVPKALTYSFSWRQLRDHLAGRVVELVDVSRVWAEVRLEQVVVLSSQESRQSGYRSRCWRDGRLAPPVAVSWRLARRLDAWPCGLTTRQQRFVSRLGLGETTVGDVCRTFRGLPMQSRLGTRGATPVLGGRDLARWGVRGVSGYLSGEADCRQFAGPRLLFQNIVAHVTRPHPHLRLIGCYDASGRVTLDTVNNLVARQAPLELHGLLGLLHSEFINWYVYAVIYNQAIRTMHFDQYVLNKIPLPSNWPRLLADLAPWSRRVEQLVASELPAAGVAPAEQTQAECEMNRIVNAAYGWQATD